eukprot:3016031-Rhodomonas_salina.1
MLNARRCCVEDRRVELADELTLLGAAFGPVIHALRKPTALSIRGKAKIEGVVRTINPGVGAIELLQADPGSPRSPENRVADESLRLKSPHEVVHERLLILICDLGQAPPSNSAPARTHHELKILSRQLAIR